MVDLWRNTVLVTFGLLASLYKSYVVTLGWGWFVVPVFKVPELPVVYALGILVTLSATAAIPDTNKKAERFLAESFVLTALVHTLIWIIHFFV